MEPPAFLNDAEIDATPARRAILTAALRLFSEKGLAATSIRDIAAASNFTNPALYRHFDSKEALALHLFEVSYRWMATRVANAVDSQHTPADKLTALADCLVDCYAEAPDAVLFTNDALRELWPLTKGRLARQSLISQTNGIVRELRGGRASAVSDAIVATAVLGTFGQWARSMYFGTLAGPPQRWRTELVAVIQRIAG